MDTTLRPWPVCPYCGHEHKDAWEWDLGPGLEGDGEYECSDCGKPFHVSRSVTIYYTTKTASNDALSRADVNPQPNKNSDSASA